MYIILFGSTTQMRVAMVRCRSVTQQCVTIPLTAPLKEELLVDILDIVEVISVSVIMMFFTTLINDIILYISGHYCRISSDV